MADGTEARFTRDANGRLRSTQFQGRSSFRELLPASAERLSRVLDSSSAGSRPAAPRPSAGDTGKDRGRAKNTGVRVTDVPIEDGVAEGYDVAPGGRTQATRKEARLQRDFATFLRARGDEVTRKRIEPPGATYPLYNDLFNGTRNQLIEAKANGTRDSLRMAIGQLADYGRFVKGAKKAVLVDEKPGSDLLELLESQGVAVIWRTGGGFADNVGGRFA